MNYTIYTNKNKPQNVEQKKSTELYVEHETIYMKFETTLYILHRCKYATVVRKHA